MLALPPLALFANACGQIHGKVCGFLQIFAVALVVPALALSSSIAPGVADDRTFWLAFLCITYPILTALTYLGICLLRGLRH